MVWRCPKTTYIWKQSINLRPELKFKSKLLKILILKKLRDREAKKEKKKLVGNNMPDEKAGFFCKNEAHKKIFQGKKKGPAIKARD